MATILNFPYQRQSSARNAARAGQSPNHSNHSARIFIFDGIRREQMIANRAAEAGEEFATFILSGEDRPHPSPRHTGRQQKR